MSVSNNLPDALLQELPIMTQDYVHLEDLQTSLLLVSHTAKEKRKLLLEGISTASASLPGKTVGVSTH